MTFPSGPLAVAVEFFIDGSWVEVTTHVRQTDPIVIKRGLAGEGSRIQPARCTFTLDDGPGKGNGAYNPLNPASPYYGKFGRNIGVRVSIAGQLRFVGEVASFTPSWDVTYGDRVSKVEAADILRRYEQSVSPLKSVMRRYLTGPTPDVPLVYFPCEEGKDSTTFESAVGENVPPLRILQGQVDAAAYDDFPASEPIPVLRSSGILRGQLPAHSATSYKFAAFFAMPDPIATNFGTLFYFEGTGSMDRWLVQQNTSGGLELFGFDKATGSLGFASGAVGFNTAGRRFVFTLTLTQVGSNIDWAMSTVDPVQGTGGINGTINGYTIGNVGRFQVGIDGPGLDGAAVGHIAVYANSVDMGALTPITQAFAGETASTRLTRLADEEGLAVVPIGAAGDSERVGPQRVNSVLNLIKEAADADGGTLFTPRDALELQFRPRSHLYNQAAALSLTYSQISPSLIPKADDKNTANDVTVKRPDAGEARYQQLTGPLNINDPNLDPDGVGVYQKTYTLNLFTDAQAADAASWSVHLGTDPSYRYPQVTVDMAAASLDAFTRAALIAADVDDRMVITDLPPDLVPDDVSLLIRGYTETITTAYQHKIVFNCAPEGPWRVAVLDESGTRLDSDTSDTTAAFEVGTATSMGVSTTGGTLWTTAPAEFPFLIRVGGVVLNVTAISGASSPQTFTVDAAPVNGVFKTIPAFTPVALAFPVYLPR